MQLSEILKKGGLVVNQRVVHTAISRDNKKVEKAT